MMNSAADKIRICLVNPKLIGPYPPLGLAYLAAYLKKYGQYDYQVKIVDGNCTKDILKDIVDFNPQAVGFTALSPQIKGAVSLAKELRLKKPDILQIIGGLHVSAEPEDTLRRGSFDFAVLGEGEETFKELLDKFVQSGRNPEAYSGIKGLAYLAGGALKINSPREEIAVLDDIPVPDRSLLDMRHYLKYYLVIRGLSGNRITTIHTSRGCPYNCIFCSCGIVFKKVRYFSVDYVIEEIKELVYKYKAKSLFFTDDTFVLNKGRIRELCLKLIDAGLHKKIRWEVQARANLINSEDLELLKLMKRAGCLQLDFGFESGSDKVLKFLKARDVSIEFNRRAISITKQAGLNVMGTFMVGVPEETEEDIELTKKFILDNYQDIDNFQVFIATPYPGAELYRICEKKGLVDPDYFRQLEKEVLPDLEHCYTDTLPCKKVIAMANSLNRLAVGKIGLKDKLKWVAFNIAKNPFQVIKMAYRSVIKC